ncbi:hypothetical protein LIN78_02215 [Leeia sp. TBRC 13508]|uniref:Uncharacterized protein n=1 Tax=Leeia speluncae TaxID=2884804 RepID=A0ABS8D2E8_9NEIS|nr:hypothetical protein [Leeia speluncae]MCB6182369.1 hypothetical protein [Leeia speluncae]
MTVAKSLSLPIARSKTAALARVIDLVAKGYHFYFSGQCPAERLLTLVRKLHEKYGVACSPAQRLIRKQQGRANAALVIFLPTERMLLQQPNDDISAATENNSLASMDDNPSSTKGTNVAISGEASLASKRMLESVLAQVDGKRRIEWLLLATNGAGLVHEEEQLRDVKGKHRLIFCGYELVRHTTRGKAAWTFRRTREEMTDWYTLLGDQLRRQRMAEVAKALQCIAHQPGFAGVREQSSRLFDFAIQRGYRKEVPFLFFVQKLSHGDRVLI